MYCDLNVLDSIIFITQMCLHQHAKAQEFLELRQRKMTALEYMARFTELACFGDDYVATYMAKVRIFENGLKLSIRGKIVGLRL